MSVHLALYHSSRIFQSPLVSPLCVISSISSLPNSTFVCFLPGTVPAPNFHSPPFHLVSFEPHTFILRLFHLVRWIYSQMELFGWYFCATHCTMGSRIELCCNLHFPLWHFGSHNAVIPERLK